MKVTHGKVRIVWTTPGGELDAITVENDGDMSVTAAVIKMIDKCPLAIGDTISIKSVRGAK